MDTLKTAVVAALVGTEMSEMDAAAADRYIDAIVGHGLNRLPVGDDAESRRRALRERFLAEYRSATTGPYARHAGAALRLALGRL